MHHTYARTNTFSCATRTWCDMLRLSGPLKRIPNTKLNKLMCLGDRELKNVAERVCNDYIKLRNVATAEVVKTDSGSMPVPFFQAVFSGRLTPRAHCALLTALEVKAVEHRLELKVGVQQSGRQNTRQRLVVVRQSLLLPGRHYATKLRAVHQVREIDPRREGRLRLVVRKDVFL